MSDVNFVENWADTTSQCKACKFFQEHNGQTACVPDGNTFEEALSQYGQCPPNGHCDYFEGK